LSAVELAMSKLPNAGGMLEKRTLRRQALPLLATAGEVQERRWSLRVVGENADCQTALGR